MVYFLKCCLDRAHYITQAGPYLLSSAVITDATTRAIENILITLFQYGQFTLWSYAFYNMHL